MATANEKLLDNTVNHSIDIQRFGNGVVRRMLAILNKADAKLTDELISALERMTPETFTVQRLDALLKEVRALNGKAYTSVRTRLEVDLLDLVKSESDYQMDLFKDVLPISVSVARIDPEVVYTAAMSRPFQVSKDRAVPLNEYLTGLSSDRAAKIRDAVRLGYLNSETTSQIVRSIRGTKTQNYADGLMQTPRYHVEGMVRTAISHMSNFTAQRFYEANDGILKGVKWISTLDSRTSPVCQARDSVIYPVDSGPRPPAHINCLTADTLVSTCNGVSNIYKRTYEGTLVEIITKSGRSITVTPNHPILTRTGWKAAGQIDCFDKLVCVSEGFDIGDHHKDNVVAKIGDLFAAADVSSDPGFVAISPTTTKDFHGDGTNGEVNVISVDSFAWNAIRKILSKNRKYKFLINRKIAGFSFLSFGSFKKFFWRYFSSSNSVMSLLCERIFFFVRISIHSGLLLFRPVPGSSVLSIDDSMNNRRGAFQNISNSFNANTGNVKIIDSLKRGLFKFLYPSRRNNNAASSQNSNDWLFAKSEFLPDIACADSVNGIEFDDVVDLRLRKNVFCHVYNLENVNNWYVANGIITHNCRSRISPVTKSWRELGIDLDEITPGTRASFDGQVPQDLTYNDWLKQQSTDRQNDILGQTKAKLFRAGQSVDKFVDNKGKTLTIQQLRERNSALFNKLGL